MADDIPRAPAEGQEIGEDGHTAPAPELSREAWKALFAGLAAGDSSALEPLYRAAAPTVFGLALWQTGSVEDASDVVQGVFLRVAQRHRRLGKVEDPRSWLLGVAHHVAIDVARRRKRRATEPLGEVAPQKLLGTQRLTKTDLLVDVKRSSDGDVTLDLPDTKLDDIVAVARSGPDRRFRAEAILELGLVRSLGTPAQQEKTLSVLNRLASSDDRVVVDMAVWSRDTKLTKEYLKGALTLLPPPRRPRSPADARASRTSSSVCCI